MSSGPDAEEEMRRRRFEILGPYANMEFGHAPHQRDRRSPYLKPALDEVKPHGRHWLWFFAAALLVIGPLEGLAIWLILK